MDAAQIKQCIGFQQLTVSTTAVTLTVPANCTGALIRAESNPVRFRADGTAPTSSVGLPISNTDTIPLMLYGNGTLKNFQVIRSGGADATLDVMYFG